MAKANQTIQEVTLPPFKDDAFDTLSSSGYQMIGKEGSNGAVFQKPGRSYVLKVFDGYDTAFLAFVKLVQQNPNPHFPRYFGKIISVNNKYADEVNYYAIRMERLSECHDHTIDYIAAYFSGYNKERDKYPFFNWEEYDQALEWIGNRPELKIACDLLIANVGKFLFDMKIDNVMQRGNTPVFIDPYKKR